MEFKLPHLPVKHREFLNYVHSNPDPPMADLVIQFNNYDAVLRRIYAQDPSNSILKTPHLNVVPLYDKSGSTDIRIRARELSSETPEQKEKYILPLPNDLRKPNGSQAVVTTLAEFKNNFNIFTEGALNDIDWTNIVAAGSSVVTPLLPVPEKYHGSKRSLRKYYHDVFTPASDVDLFLYGMTDEQALTKIMEIEDKIRNTILYETTTIRTKNTITIASQYPNRHIQIVLRIYQSLSEILTGFDVDVSCVAYDGQQVYASPRAIAAFITQVNQIDLTRRSPSYENRLSKYSHRGFEVFWTGLDRSKIDPTIFERSFTRTQGLARLLVLEKLPKPEDRDNYQLRRRIERGRPAGNIGTMRRSRGALKGNIKDQWDDEVPDWQEQDQVSSYHTFTIPYGKRFHAKNIERLLYAKDLLLNAQWNKPKNRGVYLHRHPAFFGDAEYIFHDCCGFCPKPVTEEETKVLEEESKIYVSGEISFIQNDPGRQEIGSFNPINDTDWIEMAYISDTERLCHAIVLNDMKGVKACLEADGGDPNRRDITGRTPLHLACISSTPGIVQSLVNSGARLISRLFDGRTALHLAAARGDIEIIRILLEKSSENEEAQKTEPKKPEDHELLATNSDGDKEDEDKDNEEDEESENEDSEEDEESENEDDDSYIKVERIDDATEENLLEPDIYDINATTWDNHVSPLHLAILHGHTDVVKELVTSFKADVSIPIKTVYDSENQSILNLVLALTLPLHKAREMSQTLLQLGASVAQADAEYKTPLHYLAASDKSELLDTYLENDRPAVQRALNHFSIIGLYNPGFYSVLVMALRANNPVFATRLLDIGAEPEVEFSEILNAIKRYLPRNPLDEHSNFNHWQPIWFAITKYLPSFAIDLIARGVNINTEVRYFNDHETILETTRKTLERLKKFYSGRIDRRCRISSPMNFTGGDESYIAKFQPGSYKMFIAKGILQRARQTSLSAEKSHTAIARQADEEGTVEKYEVIARLISEYAALENELLKRGAKTFSELHPEKESRGHDACSRNSDDNKEDGSVKDPLRIRFKFHGTSSTTYGREGYLELFEASWNGDIDTIRKLTLGLWGSSNPPLELAVNDDRGLTCLSISILRGHLDVAKSILEIIGTQYKPTFTTRRFEIDIENDDYQDEELPITSIVHDDTFTHDNIGEAVTHAESDVFPIAALNRCFDIFGYMSEQLSMDISGFKSAETEGSIMMFAIYKNDISLLDFILEMRMRILIESEFDEVIAWLPEDEFRLAISLGRTECLAKLIQSTGIGFPLAILSMNSDVEPEQDGLSYQGLSVRGQKRSDWAKMNRDTLPELQDVTSPLLHSALKGNLASTEFFLSTAPARYYIGYLNSHLDNAGVKRLTRSKHGVEGSVHNWLQAGGMYHHSYKLINPTGYNGRQSSAMGNFSKYFFLIFLTDNLVLHCAILCDINENSEHLVRYLVDHHPECLEVRSKEGYTPLALAFALHRIAFAQILISAGANQAVRDNKAKNLLHHCLVKLQGEPHLESEGVKKLVNLLDKQHVSTMLIERAGKSSRTPLGRWLQSLSSSFTEKSSEIASIVATVLDLASSTDQKLLDVFDGLGNTITHQVVKQGLPYVLEQILDRRPDLLYRESAVGTTPLEMAVDKWVNKITSHPPLCPDIADRELKYLLQDKGTESDEDILVRICRERAQKRPAKRKLVSLFEANEITKRLAVMSSSSRLISNRVESAHESFSSRMNELDQWIEMVSLDRAPLYW
ncbi:hypothetical protein N7495_006512 [Penicillium taxi]|uniref:uncharacterized protein n=1 Tax=Penicillium taxi TaxID=168475 RepID=UPI002544EA5C|nr:uncharacterized protein N7495_006512 [Penicillium taxi]KAJ5894821.1 hypothetical protein N7495_006512 [Penicillium taxi]